MSIDEFIGNNRRDIDSAICSAYGDNCQPADDSDREDWILNDEGLYLWAQSEGVQI